MVRFDRDMHAVHGRYQFEVDEITEHDGPEVTVEFTILSEPGRKQPPLRGRGTFTLRGDLITLIEGSAGTSTP